MASPEEIGDYKFRNTQFVGENEVRHTTFRSDPSLGTHGVSVTETWYRGREIGRGLSGTVFLETSENGKQRAVKRIAKDRNSTITIDYNRELMAMATLSKRDNLFVQFFGWYENPDYVYIAMEYMSHGDLRNYLEKERSEDEAKVVTRQLLEGLVIIHQEGFAHRDLKPENVFVVSLTPVRVKIADFGLAKLARSGTAFRAEGGTRDYCAPEVAGTDPSRETSEYTDAIDIWALGCITHEMLTGALPFRGWRELNSYCSSLKLPTNSMLSRNISKNGIEFVEKMLAYPPERRIAAKEALDSEWLRLGNKGAAGPETGEGLAGPALFGGPAPSRAAGVSGESEDVPPDSPATASQTRQLLVANGINPNHLTPRQFAAFQGQNPITQHKYLQQYAQSVAALTGRAVSALQQGGPISEGMPNMAQNPPNHESPMMPQTTEGATIGDYYANLAMRCGVDPGAGNRPLHDYHIQLMLLEQQNKERLMMARAQRESLAQHGDGQRENYQMQLMLLEQQKKQRLMIARAEQESLSEHGDSQRRMEQALSQSMSSGSRAAPSPQPMDNPQQNLIYSQTEDTDMMGTTQGGGSASNESMTPPSPSSHPGSNGQMGQTDMSQINPQIGGQQTGSGGLQMINLVWQQQEAQAQPHVQAQQQQQAFRKPMPKTKGARDARKKQRSTKKSADAALPAPGSGASTSVPQAPTEPHQNSFVQGTGHALATGFTVGTPSGNSASQTAQQNAAGPTPSAAPDAIAPPASPNT